MTREGVLRAFSVPRTDAVIVLLCAAAACGSMHSADKASHRSNESDTRVSIPAGDGQMVAVDIRRASTDGRYYVICREPESGVTWWDVGDSPVDGFPTTALFGGDSQLVFAVGKLVRFTLAPRSLLIVESSSAFPSLDAAERAVVRRKAPVEYWTAADLSSIPREFLITPNVAYTAPPEIRSVKKTATGWLITLLGPNGDFADITLDEKYRTENVRTYR